jgi:hypothetical protein
MSAPRPYESELLAPAERIVLGFAAKYPRKSFEARLQLLEATASRLGGFWLEAFHAQFEIDSIAPHGELVERAKEVIEAIETSGIHPALALSALARERLDDASRRLTGAYHTDFRLATRLARFATPRQRSVKVIDPACGAGMLLAALTIQACGSDRKKVTRWLGDSVHAADRSPVALRGALLTLASLTSDLGALAVMRARWLLADSLLVPEKVWRSLAVEGFDIVIANPPWEKVKLTRHEYLKSRGHERHYGSEVGDIDSETFVQEKNGVADYARQLVDRYPSLANGEPDLYIAFTHLFERLCKAGGTMAAIIPAGFIRSQGTESVRRHLFEVSERVSISVIENRARFFSIDSRFKFLVIGCTKAADEQVKRKPIILLHEKGIATGLQQFGHARIGRDSLAAVRPDASLPEVRSNEEWRIYRKMVATGVSWQERAYGWRAEFCREVDMTRERPSFRVKTSGNALPLVEGRMVQQHRFGAKGYANGSGRRAIWETFALGNARVQPQFWVVPNDLPGAARHRVDCLRGGFCDITGQTNERSMMAALIPLGVVCGNKVPTVLFPDDPSLERLLVWCAVMNSLPFDWMLRRIVTTTVNYFLLLSVPMPRLARDGLPWRRLAAAARELRELDAAGHSDDLLLRAASLRAEIDAEIAVAYGLAHEDLPIVMRDFPLVDRQQPALPSEERSTITTDLMLSASAKRMRKSAAPWLARVEEAIDLGAKAYVPSEFSHIEQFEEASGANTG